MEGVPQIWTPENLKAWIMHDFAGYVGCIEIILGSNAEANHLVPFFRQVGARPAPGGGPEWNRIASRIALVGISLVHVGIKVKRQSTLTKIADAHSASGRFLCS